MRTLVTVLAMVMLVASPLFAQPPRQYTVQVTHSLQRLPDGRAQGGLATIVITDGATRQVVKRFVAAYPTTFGPEEIDRFVRVAVDNVMLTVPEPPGPLAPDTTYTIVK